MLFRALAVGVNVGPGARPLRFAEKDAWDFSEVFSSDLAAPDAAATMMLGARAPVNRVLTALAALANDPPEHLVLFFSGHGSEHGILLADGLLPHSTLAAFLRRINARTILLVLDVCSAASFAPVFEFGGEPRIGAPLRQEWFEVLANAHPGVRLMFSTGPGRYAVEGAGVSNGHFTRALIDTLHSSSGTICTETNCWVSDTDAFGGASKLMLTRHARSQIPVACYLTGDMPLVVSQHAGVIGGADVTASLVPGWALVDISILALGRKRLPTWIRCTAIDEFGYAFDSRTRAVIPRASADSGQFRYRVPLENLPPRLDAYWPQARRVDVAIEVLDASGRTLASTATGLVYQH